MQTPLEILKTHFGYPSFREGQEELISTILAGRDALGVMPTGAGKSVCFQVPGLLLPGITLVVSPLISLMKDQVGALTAGGISAAFINSSLTARQLSVVYERAQSGVYKLIYIAPERLLATDFLSFACNTEISMLTVDEAHCISQWGQDFRPSYAQIPEFIAVLPHRPIVSAFTATATPRVREDILRLLNLDNPTVLVTGFDRPNLHFEVQTPKDKFAALNHFLNTRREQSGVIYCATRKVVEEVCEQLKMADYNVSRYHAGLPDRERHDNQDDFLYDRIQIMVATNAFGMGIDKSNVAFVVHYNMPKDVESYYQEAGRAGRDGGNAHCLLLYSGQDARTQLWMIDNNQDTEYSDYASDIELKERRRKRLKEMTFYATTAECLRHYILKYFGEKPPDVCDNCGNCKGDFELVDITVDTQKILSCVSRTGERFGAQMIIDVLRGSRNEKVLRWGFDRLSTYNISEKNDKQLGEIIRFLVQNEYLHKSDEKFSIITLGERAWAVLRGGEKVTMRRSVNRKISEQNESFLTKNKRSNAVQTGNINPDLFAALKALRLEIAAEQRVPAFVIFADTTLVDMCLKQPKTEAEMLEVHGIGEVKLQRYGRRFLEVIMGFEGKN